ncbi:hypothetical protein [Kibdelosporangium aridum]|nr:hypothetical protein [Kibdelosporangium aridum]
MTDKLRPSEDPFRFAVLDAITMPLPSACAVIATVRRLCAAATTAA